MKTMQSPLIDEDLDTTYALVEEFFGTMKADAVYFEITHPTY